MSSIGASNKLLGRDAAKPSGTVEDIPRAELRTSALDGARWLTIARGMAEFNAVVVQIVLARLMAPAEFGRAAVALTAVGLLAIGSNGLTMAVVQRGAITYDELGAATGLAWCGAIVLSGIAVALVPLSADAFGHGVASMIAVAILACPISAFGAVPLAILQRRLEFRRMGLIETLSLVVGAIVSVALVLAGAGGMGLIGGALAAEVTTSCLALIAAPIVAPRWRPREALRMMRLGVPAAGSSFVFTLARNIDYAILATRLPAATLGLYWRAYQIGVDYQSKISWLFARVAFPLYSRAETTADLLDVRARMTRLQTVLIAPLLASLIVTAPEVVPLVFGPAWSGAVHAMQVMAVAGIATSIAVAAGPAFAAAGKPGVLLTWSVLQLAVLVPLLLVVAPMGLAVIAVAMTGASLLFLVAIYALMRAAFGLPQRAVCRDALPGLLPSAALVVSAFPVKLGLEGVGVPSLASAVGGIVVGLAAYAAFLRVVFPDTYRDLRDAISRLMRPGA